MHRGIIEGCCRVWHREHHAEFIEDVLSSFRERPLWIERVSKRIQARERRELLESEGRGRKRKPSVVAE